MGTNYYAHIIPTKERKKVLCDLINNSENFNNIIREVQNTYGSIEYPSDFEEGNFGKVHLGKRSGGWKFLWNPNIYKLRQGHTEKTEDGRYHWVEDPPTVGKIYELTKESIKQFIDRKDILIYDEYGELQDKEEFFQMALDWTTWTDHTTGEEKEAWDGESYELYEQSKGNHNRWTGYETEYTKFLTSIGYTVKWPYTDFYSDGLRFSTSTQFS